MAARLRWDDTVDLGIALADKYRDLNPLEISLTDVHRYVMQLPTFADDPTDSDDTKLEAIQQAWHDEWEDRTR